MLIRMDIKSLIVAGGPIPSVVTLVPRQSGEGMATELPIRIGVVEAAALSMGVAGTEGRPITHDLLLSVVRRLGAELTGVAIVDVRGTTFYANLMLTLPDGTKAEVDCRPSDALALAVRAGVPVFADDAVLRSASMPDFAGVEKERQAREMEEFHSFVESLSADDFSGAGE